MLRLMHSVLIIVILCCPALTHAFTKISLEKYYIKEGNFSVLLFEPQRIVTPFENKMGRMLDYSYVTYIPSFDISYTASSSNWQKNKDYERKKYGYTLSSVDDDLNTAIDGIRYMLKSRLNTNIKQNYRGNISYKNTPGKEAELEFVSQNIKYIVKLKVYIINDKQYILQTAFPAKYINLSNYEAFLNSFELHD